MTRLLLASLLLSACAAPHTPDATHDRREAARVASGHLLRDREAPPPRPRKAASRSRAPITRAGALLNWHALALCESTDNPRATSASGKYRGLYQFDLRTWRSVGGHGDPARASRREQTLRAQLLFADRGRSPWPECGVRL